MKKTKKIVALLLTFCMAFGMFAHMAPVNAEELEWFATAEELETADFAELEVTTTAGESKYYQYTAETDGFFDFISATTTNTEFNCSPYVVVYDADGEQVAANTIAYLDYFVVETGETYYFEFYSRYYSSGYQKAADTMTIKAAVLVPEVIEDDDFASVTTEVVDGGAKLYKYVAQADGFIDFISGTSANSTETEVCRPNVTIYNEEAEYQFGGNMSVVKALFVKEGQTYIIEISSQRNYKPVADTITWTAEVCDIETLEVPETGKTVSSTVLANGSKFYKYTATVDGYFEIMEASSAAFVADPGEEDQDFTRFQICDVNGMNLDSGTIENIDPIAVKIGDVIYIEVYSQGGYDYDTYAPIKIADTLTWEVEAYECGTVGSPEEIEDMTDFYQELVLDPESYGRYYTYTAPDEGEVVFYPSYWEADCELEIVITMGEDTYRFSESDDVAIVTGYWGPEEYPAVKVSVEEGDVLNIHVYETSENVNEIGLVGLFTPPVGRPGNPLNVTEEGGEITVAAGETYNIQIPYGMAAVLNATGEFTVVGTDYYDELTDEMDSVNGKLTVSGCYLLAITNNEDDAITINIVIEYPEGSMDNPYVLDCYNKLDLRFDAYQYEFDYYTFTAKDDCTLYFDMPEVEATAITGWVINLYKFVDDPVEGQTCTGYMEIHPWLETLTTEVALQEGEYVIFFIAPAVYDADYDYVSATAMEATRIQCTVATVTENPFDDVQEADYYAEPVMWAYANGITTGKGEGTFAPTGQCTRAEIVTFLWRAAGCPEPTITENPFTDVAADEYYTKAVLWAYENEITTGKGNGRFATFEVCTRAEVVTFLWRAMGKPAPSITSHTFADVAANDYYTTAVLWAFENGITTGKDATTFGTNSKCIRADVVTFLYRTFK